MTFSGKVCLMTILKVTKNQDFSLLLKDALLEKPQGVRLTPLTLPSLPLKPFKD